MKLSRFGSVTVPLAFCALLMAGVAFAELAEGTPTFDLPRVEGAAEGVNGYRILGVSETTGHEMAAQEGSPLTVYSLQTRKLESGAHSVQPQAQPESADRPARLVRRDGKPLAGDLIVFIPRPGARPKPLVRVSFQLEKHLVALRKRTTYFKLVGKNADQPGVGTDTQFRFLDAFDSDGNGVADLILLEAGGMGSLLPALLHLDSRGKWSLVVPPNWGC